jgi:hypothetical protein
MDRDAADRIKAKTRVVRNSLFFGLSPMDRDATDRIEAKTQEIPKWGIS